MLQTSPRTGTGTDSRSSDFSEPHSQTRIIYSPTTHHPTTRPPTLPLPHLELPAQQVAEAPLRGPALAALRLLPPGAVATARRRLRHPPPPPVCSSVWVGRRPAAAAVPPVPAACAFPIAGQAAARLAAAAALAAPRRGKVRGRLGTKGGRAGAGTGCGGGGVGEPRARAGPWGVRFPARPTSTCFNRVARALGLFPRRALISCTLFMSAHCPLMPACYAAKHVHCAACCSPQQPG